MYGVKAQSRSWSRDLSLTAKPCFLASVRFHTAMGTWWQEPQFFCVPFTNTGRPSVSPTWVLPYHQSLLPFSRKTRLRSTAWRSCSGEGGALAPGAAGVARAVVRSRVGSRNIVILRWVGRTDSTSATDHKQRFSG